MFKESKTRSVVKTISWRFLATLITMLIVYIITGELKIAAIIGSLEVVLKIVFYYFHERFWDKIKLGRKEFQPKVIWLTGLSGAGKSTLAEALVERLKKKGIKTEHLDGDTVRAIFPSTGFTKEDRIKHVKRVGFLASKLESNGVYVVASFISPYKESRDFVRGLCNDFVEIHVSTPLEVCETRDVKGLYKKARSGEIQNFTGISDPFEAPENPEISIDTSNISVEKAIGRIMKVIE